MNQRETIPVKTDKNEIFKSFLQHTITNNTQLQHSIYTYIYIYIYWYYTSCWLTVAALQSKANSNGLIIDIRQWQFYRVKLIDYKILISFPQTITNLRDFERFKISTQRNSAEYKNDTTNGSTLQNTDIFAKTDLIR